MILLRQSTAVTISMGPFVDDTDGKTAETALTISQADIRLSKNGGDFAQSNNATGATADEEGFYAVPLDTTDTGTLGILRVAISESGALPVWVDCLVVPANVYDSLVLGTDTLNAEVASMAADVITATAFDESTAFPLKSADTGATAVARTGADSDTLEIISDQIDGISTPATPPSAAAIADAVWDEALSGHTTAGSAGKALGDAPTASQLSAAVASGEVSTSISGSFTVVTGTTWERSLSGLGDMTDRTALYVMVKDGEADDDEAIIAWKEGTGLSRLSGEATTAGYGAITVDDASDGDITISLTEDATGGLTADVGEGLTIAVKCIKADELWERWGSNFSIELGKIDATS